MYKEVTVVIATWCCYRRYRHATVVIATWCCCRRYRHATVVVVTYMPDAVVSESPQELESLIEIFQLLKAVSTLFTPHLVTKLLTHNSYCTRWEGGELLCPWTHSAASGVCLEWGWPVLLDGWLPA